jgi:hypothetical protein
MAKSNKGANPDMCMQFHDKFYMERDKLSYSEPVPTPALNENGVINARPYGLSEAHKRSTDKVANLQMTGV